MTTINEIIKNIKVSLRQNFKIVKAEIKMIRDDLFSVHLPVPDRVKPFPHRVGMDGDDVFVPVSFGPDGVDLTIDRPSFEKEYGLVSDYPAACLAAKGLMTMIRKSFLQSVRMSYAIMLQTITSVRTFASISLRSRIWSSRLTLGSISFTAKVILSW